MPPPPRPLPRRNRFPWAVLRSFVVLVSALVLFVAVNAGGGEVTSFALPSLDGDARLACDLAWVVLAGVMAIAWVARFVTFAPRRHAFGFLIGLAAITVAAIVQLGADFPPWFSVGLGLALPVQYALGMRAAPRRRRQAGGLSSR